MLVLRTPIRQRGGLVQKLRALSSYKYIDVEDTGKKYSIVRLNKPPVNSLDGEMCQEIVSVFEELNTAKDCRGVVLTSAVPKVFSGGLDIMQMYNADQNNLAAFWSAVRAMNITIFKSPLVNVAAINGACPAGGCMMAFGCDYRMMADGKFTIGLNETQLGLAAPSWLAASMRLLVGHRRNEHMLSLGVLVPPPQAIELGMVDQVVPIDDVLTASCNEMEKWLKIPDVGRIATKQLLRKAYIEEFYAREQEDMDLFTQGVLTESVQATMGKYLQALKNKRK